MLVWFLLEQLKATAAKSGMEDMNLRLHAVTVIGRQGGPELIPFLVSLRANPNEYPEEHFNEWRNKVIDGAIHEIRLRSWKQPK
jgi:hypothetical protein